MFPSAPQKINLSTGQLSYRESGAGPAILFLHGMNGNSKSWRRQFEFFSSDFRVIAWDAPGYGLSDLVAPTVDAYAGVALEAVAALGVDRMGIVGHSMGGIVAAKMARMAPLRVSKLVLSSSFPGRGEPVGSPLQERYARRIDELKTLPPEEYVSRRARAVLPDGADEKVVAFLKEIAAEMRIDGLRAAAKMAQYADNRPFLSRITAPTLVITASCDRVLPYKFSLPFIESIPDVRHVAIEGAGHAAYLEAPALYNRHLKQFIAARRG